MAHNLTIRQRRIAGAAPSIRRWTVSPFFSCNASFNHFGLCNKKLDAMMRAGLAEPDHAKRLEIYHDVDAKLAEIFPYDFLYAADWWRIMSPRLHGVPPMPDNSLVLTDAWLSK